MFGFGGASAPQGQQQGSQGGGISAAQAAGLAQTAHSVYSNLPPEMKTQVNNMAQQHATNYVKQQMGMAPTDPNAHAQQTPAGNSSCPSMLFGGSAPATGSAAAPPAAPGAAPAPASGPANSAGMLGMLGGLMGGASAAPAAQQTHQQPPAGQASSGSGMMDFSSLLSFAGGAVATKSAESEQKEDRASFSHLWEAAGTIPPPKPATPAPAPAPAPAAGGFDPLSALFSMVQQPPTAKPTATH